MTHPVNIPGFENQKIEVKPPGFASSAKLLVNGQEAVKGKKRGEMLLQRDDGTQVVAKWKGQFLDVPKLVVDGVAIDVVEPLKWYQWIWGGLPILLLFVGGLLGGICGAIAFSINIKIFRADDIHIMLQYILTAVISFFALIIYVVLAILVAGAIGT